MNSAIMLATTMGIEPRLTEERSAEIVAEVEREKYQAFLAAKAQRNRGCGFKPVWMPDWLFDYQQYLCEWAIETGRAGLFTDTGTGKTPMQLVCAENVVRKTNKKVLIATPLAVASQTQREAAKFGIEATISRDGTAHKGITITNYERLHYFDSADFVMMICDESGILKNASSKTKAVVTEFMRCLPYRLLCTATAAPNDYIELGNSSEVLGYMGFTDMLNKFFKNDENNTGTGRMYGQGRTWRFRGHAEEPFWRYLAGFIRAMRKPSDFGFDDSRFELPPLIERDHVVQARTMPEGFLFDIGAKGVREEKEESRRTITERCEKAAELAATGRPVVICCNLNPEGDLLEKMIPDLIQISGKTSENDMRKREETFDAFSAGQVRGIITKAKIASRGLNWQHCAHFITFPNFSFEEYYQFVRRFWRFGQTQPVISDRITTESGERVKAIVDRKAAQADRMFSSLVAHMRQAMTIDTVKATKEEVIPQWLS